MFVTNRTLMSSYKPTFQKRSNPMTGRQQIITWIRIRSNDLMKITQRLQLTVPFPFIRLKERDDRSRDGEKVPDRYETVFKKKDGAEVPVEANVRIIDYKGQKATFAVIRDITKQKEILAAMQASAGQSNGLKNQIPICAGCFKIRDEDQESHPWVSPAVYINDRLPNINFSHGMCPDCMAK